MTLPGEGLKNWIILPSIMNKKNIEEVVMNQGLEQYSSKLKLPELNNNRNGRANDTTEKCISSSFIHPKQQRRCNKTSYKGNHEPTEILEFVNIVNNPPVKPKFISTTEVRVSQQAKNTICGRWLGHSTRSVKRTAERKSENRTNLDLRHFNSEDNELADDFSDEITSLSSVELRLLGNNELDESYNIPNDVLIPTYKQERIFHLLSEIDSSFAKNNPHATTLKRLEKSCKECLAESLMGTYLDNYEYLRTRQIELEARQKRMVPSYKNDRQKPSSTTQGQYHMKVSMREVQDVESSSEKNLQASMKKVCERYETKCKSSLDTKRSSSSEDTLRTNTVKVYPFYEMNWEAEGIANVGNWSNSVHEIETVNKTNISKVYECFYDKFSVDKKASNALIVSKLKLKSKREDRCSFNTQRSDNSVLNGVQNGGQEGSRSSKDGNEKRKLDDNRWEQEVLDLDEKGSTTDNVKPKTADQVFLQTESYLLHLVANTERLTNNEIIRLIENGDIDFHKFLIIKQLIPLYEKEWRRKWHKENMITNPDSRVRKLVDFFDRLEKLFDKLSSSKKYSHELEGSASKKIVSDLVVLGFNSAGQFDKRRMEEQARRVNKKRRQMNKKYLKPKKGISQDCDNEGRFQPRKISTQNSMLVGAVALVQHEHSKKSSNFQSSNFNQKFPRNSNFHEKLLGNKNSRLRKMLNIRKDDEETVLLANPPSSRNSFVSSFESMSSILAAKASSFEPMSTILAAEASTFQSMSSILAAQRLQNIQMDHESKSSNKEGSKVFDQQRNEVQFGLRNDFELFQSVSNLMTMVNSEVTCVADKRAERDTKVDYTAHFNLVNKNRIETFCKAFARVDHRGDGEIPVEGLNRALRFVDSLLPVPEKYIDYTIQILDLDLLSLLTIKMFCVVCTILETMVDGGMLIREAVDALCLIVSQGKMIWYKKMFNEAVDFDRNYISLETVKLELFAGGMDDSEEREITDRITTDDQRISFVDFVAYIPLFISFHEKICNNTFNMKLE